EQQLQIAIADDASRMARVAGHLDVDRAFVDDDDDENLSGIRDGRVALQDLDALESSRRLEARRRVVHRRRSEWRADRESSELPDLFVARRGVAVDFDGGNGFAGLKGPRHTREKWGGPFRAACQQCEQSGDQRILTFVVTSACL